MGVKELWTVLSPYCVRKPIHVLRGKIVAIDLAGWVCEGLNVVDYFVHPRHHLKNLFFRTSLLLWEEIIPVFVLEGAAPKLKSKVISDRNEIEFRGVKPKKKFKKQPPCHSNSRKKFDYMLRQCEILLNTMGLVCVQAPGEAEAYCAFLNKKGLVDGVISQDSDCFAYGAVRVYRNFSMASHRESSQSGCIDIYDMNEISKFVDFGQNKTIVMALLCGCDYCPEGIGGIGRNGVLRLFSVYRDTEILDKIRSWRQQDTRYTELQIRVNDKSICGNCGHQGNSINHSKKGCGLCCTLHGCDDTLWKEQRLCIKAELNLRHKALSCNSTFPPEDIIKEFLFEPPMTPCLNICWRQPNIIKFIHQIGHLLQWSEIYCFQKFFPVLTRWQLLNSNRIGNPSYMVSVDPCTIQKKRTLKGVPSLEVLWKDENGNFKGLIPDEQLKEFEAKNSNGLQDLWTTVEPFNLMQQKYSAMVQDFLDSKENKNNKITKSRKNLIKYSTSTRDEDNTGGSLDNLQDLITATNEIDKYMKPNKGKKNSKTSGLQTIDKFLRKKYDDNLKASRFENYSPKCSTPKTKYFSSDNENDESQNVSDIVSGIINGIGIKGTAAEITKHGGRTLFYEPMNRKYNFF